MRILLTLLISVYALGLHAQDINKKKMAKLAYMTGEWVGISKSYKDGKVINEVPAYEKISYDLNKSIIVIELNSSTLKLHTVIYYDEKEDTYYYNAVSEKGGRKLKASFEKGRFIVHASDSKRFIFESYGKGGFREYGEILKDGQWEIYFEDVFLGTD